MESLQQQPLAFSSSPDLISATSRLILNPEGDVLLNIEVFDFGNHDDGASPILLVLHGVCESAETLGIQTIVAEAKKRSVRVAMLELEGHGLSSGAKCVCGDFDRLVRHAVKFVQFAVSSLTGDDTTAPYAITGMSLGGVLALYAAEEISRQIGAGGGGGDTNPFIGVAPIAPAVGVDPRAVPPAPIVSCLSALAFVAPALQLSMLPLEDPTHYNCPTDTQRNFSGNWPLATAKMLINVTSKRVRNDLKDGKLTLEMVDNVFIVAGKADQVVPFDSIETLHEKVSPKSKEFLPLAKDGHDLMFHTKSANKVTQALFDWIESNR